MINLARFYLNTGQDGKNDIMFYYNEYCYPLVPRGRRYKIQPHDDWCAAFVSVIAHKAGIKSGFPFEVSTYYQKAMLQNSGHWFTEPSKVLENDLVFFDWNGSGTPQHVGIAVSAWGGMLETIEGNKGDKVAFRKIPLSSPLILGFGRVPEPHDVEDLPTIEHMARAALRGEYGDGKERQATLGDDYDIVQARVNEILKRQK